MLSSVIVVGAIRSACLMGVTMFVARFLGAAEYGDFAYIISIMAAVKLFADPGLPLAFSALAKINEISSFYMRRVWAMLGIFHAFALCFVLAAYWGAGAHDSVGVSYAAVLAGFSTVMIQQSIWPLILQTAEKFELSVSAQLAHLVCSLCLLTSILVIGYFERLTVLSALGTYIVCYVLLCTMYSRKLSNYYYKPSKIGFKALAGRYYEFIRALFFIGLITGLGEILSRTIFKLIMTEGEFGVFSVALQLIFMTTVFSVVAMPKLNNQLSHAFSESTENIAEVLKNSINEITVFIVLSFGLVLCCTPILVSFLGEGEYADLQIIAPLASLCAISQFLGQLATIILLSDKKYFLQLRSTIYSAIVNTSLMIGFYISIIYDFSFLTSTSLLQCFLVFVAMNFISAGILCARIYGLYRDYFKYIFAILLYSPALLSAFAFCLSQNPFELDSLIWTFCGVLSFSAVFLFNRSLIKSMSSNCA